MTRRGGHPVGVRAGAAPAQAALARASPAAPVGTAALVAGLLLGPRAPLAVPLPRSRRRLLGSRAAVRLALAGAVVAGALVAQARLEAIDATRLAPRIGHAVRERVPAPRRAAGAAVRRARWPRCDSTASACCCAPAAACAGPPSAWARCSPRAAGSSRCRRRTPGSARAACTPSCEPMRSPTPEPGAEGSRGSSTACGRGRRRSCAAASRRPRPPCCAAWLSATTRRCPTARATSSGPLGSRTSWRRRGRT